MGWWHSQYMESHEIPWFQTTQQHRKNAVIFQMGRKNQQYLGNFQSQYWDPLESNDSNRDRQTIVFLVWEGGPRWGENHLQTNHNKVTGCWFFSPLEEYEYLWKSNGIRDHPRKEAQVINIGNNKLIWGCQPRCRKYNIWKCWNTGLFSKNYGNMFTSQNMGTSNFFLGPAAMVFLHGCFIKTPAAQLGSKYSET